MNYDEGEIQIYHIESLSKIERIKTINYDSCTLYFINIAQITSLQVIDNVIVVHNFERCESIIIDIKSDNVDKILCNKTKLHS